MKKQTIVAVSLVLGLFMTLAYSTAFAQSLVHGLIPAGSCSLPAGRYMLTNMNSGHSLYVEINSTGKLFAQDPGKMHITATATPHRTFAQSPNTPAVQPTSPAQPAATPQQNSGSVWSGLLKQGVNSLLAPNQTPAQ